MTDKQAHSEASVEHSYFFSYPTDDLANRKRRYRRERRVAILYSIPTLIFACALAGCLFYCARKHPDIGMLWLFEGIFVGAMVSLPLIAAMWPERPSSGSVAFDKAVRSELIREKKNG